MAEPRGARADALSRAIAALGVDVSGEARADLLGWLDGVVAWNARIDLTAARGDDELVDLMVADALVLSSRVEPGARVVDVGSGAGAPGLALSIVRPDLDVTLVEPLDKRVAFLRRSAGSLARGAARPPTIVRGRGEDLAARAPAFNAAISRATLPPAQWLALGAELAPRGAVWVLLAQGEPPSLEGWSIAEDVRYTWPLTGAPRRAVRFTSG